MTVNAYLVKSINTKIKNDEIIIEKVLERTPSFNLNNNERLLELFQEHNCNHTNYDLTGEIVIDKLSWEKISDKLLHDNYTSNELNTYKKITNDLKNNEILFYECF